MDKITSDSLLIAVMVIMALAGAIATLGKAVDVIKDWRKPQASIRSDLDRYANFFATDKHRLDAHDRELEALREGQRVTCTGLKALLGHELHNGNGDEMQSAAKALDTYLINK